jgi:hypothetical protein
MDDVLALLVDYAAELTVDGLPTTRSTRPSGV